MEICGACNHDMHKDQCSVTAVIDDNGVDKIVRCECPVGVSPQIFQGQILSQISQQLAEMLAIQKINQDMLRLVLQGMARAQRGGSGIITPNH